MPNYSNDSDQLQAELSTKEVLLRLDIERNTKKGFENLPDVAEAHEEYRQIVLAQIDHYQRIIDSLMPLVAKDHQAWE